MIVAPPDEQERRAVIVAVLDLGRGIRIQERQSAVPQDPAASRDLVAIVNLLRFRGIQLVGERVVELFRAE